MKYHLHDEQFDGHLHAACARVDPVAPDAPRAKFFVEDLAAVSWAGRCRACVRYWWPYGGEPKEL